MKKIISILLVMAVSVQYGWTDPNPAAEFAFVMVDYTYDGTGWVKIEWPRELYEALRGKYPNAKFITIPCPFSVPCQRSVYSSDAS
jgi:hypothetical protein